MHRSNKYRIDFPGLMLIIISFLQAGEVMKLYFLKSKGTLEMKQKRFFLLVFGLKKTDINCLDNQILTLDWIPRSSTWVKWLWSVGSKRWTPTKLDILAVLCSPKSQTVKEKKKKKPLYFSSKFTKWSPIKSKHPTQNQNTKITDLQESSSERKKKKSVPVHPFSNFFSFLIKAEEKKTQVIHCKTHGRLTRINK